MNPRPPQDSQRSQRFRGKYRGTVVDNVDIEQIGRILADVPAIPGRVRSWAMPCVPYAGPGVGMHFIPPIGANVWIEFEGGDPNRPVWTGCFWEPGDLPAEANADAAVKLIKTEHNTLIIDDTPETGGVRVTSEPPATDAPNTAIITPN